MKILNICSNINENFGYHENIFPYYQSKLGNDVISVTSRVQGLINGERHILKEGNYSEKGIKVLRIEYAYKIGNKIIKFKNFTKILYEFKPDIIFCHGLSPINFFQLIKYKKNNKCILLFDNHADLINSARNKIWKIFYYKIFLGTLYKKYDKYIDKYYGVTPYRIDFLVNLIGIPKEKIELLPLGYEDDEINEIKREKFFFEKRYKIKMKENDKVIVFGGKIDSDKKFDNVIEAFNKLNQENLKLIIFGKVNCEKIETMIEENENIYFLGWKESKEKYEILINSDLAVWPEFHTTLIEDCLGSELPMLIFKNRNSEHLLRRGNGIFLNNSSVDEILDKLKIALKDKKLSILKEKAKEAKEDFSYYNITKKFLAGIKE
ncbi:glycosyltransferase [Fusobacterium ulcerans]|uniref:Glycosyl transferase family 1 domain-containing protein n=1 Tax=Fusobacterium ulcerans 12-1B TaxID=457404 RepID=H1PUF4_9FUSO|nr:glycosyltransferase [Fusobacterium ulcerans]EHO80369.1 hypothetical protein HMPREF0402_02047 [Fusobacterium ulcerans 12-1B]